MYSWRDKAKRFGQGIKRGVDGTIDRYNETIDKIHEPTVGVGLDNKTMLFIGGAVVVFLLFFRRK